MKNEYFEKSYNEKDCTICRLRANGLIFRREFSDGVTFKFSFRRIIFLPENAKEESMSTFWGIGGDILDYMIVDQNTILFRSKVPPIKVIEYFLLCGSSFEPGNTFEFSYIDNIANKAGVITAINGDIKSQEFDSVSSESEFNELESLLVEEMSELPDDFISMEASKIILVSIASNIGADVRPITNYILKYLLQKGRLLELNVIDGDKIVFKISPEFNLFDFKKAVAESIRLFGKPLGVSSISMECNNTVGKVLMTKHSITAED